MLSKVQNECMNTQVNPLLLFDECHGLFYVQKGTCDRRFNIPSEERGGNLTHDESTHPVTHLSSNLTQACLTSVLGRDWIEPFSSSLPNKLLVQVTVQVNIVVNLVFKVAAWLEIWLISVFFIFVKNKLRYVLWVTNIATNKLRLIICSVISWIIRFKW